MTRSTVMLILALIEQALKYGPEALIAIMNAKDKDDWTAEEIRALKITKKPEPYFERQNNG